MSVFTSKTSTDPGPFDALRPAGELRTDAATAMDAVDASTLAGQRGQQQSTQSAGGPPDEDSELDRLYRFQEIPVTAEMRRELLGAKLPLASADQLADTQPPNKSGLSAPAGPAFVDRHGPTEPALPAVPAVPRPRAPHASEPSMHAAPLLDTDRYSTTAPTLLSVRRRRLRNRRLVIGGLAAMLLAVLSGVAWRRYTRPPESLAADSSAARDSSADRAKTPRIAGNRPASPPAPRSPAKPAGDAIEGAANSSWVPGAVPTSGSPSDSPVGEHRGATGSETANPDSQSAQLSSPPTDATSSPPLSADSRSAARDLPPAKAGTAAPRSTSPTTTAIPRESTDPASKAEPVGKPARGKAFDPEELIF